MVPDKSLGESHLLCVSLLLCAYHCCCVHHWRAIALIRQKTNAYQAGFRACFQSYIERKTPIMCINLQKALQRSVTSFMLALCLIIGLSGSAFAMDDDKSKTITITNLMTEELLAPVLIVPTRYDRKIFQRGLCFR